jgi:hypothetical protein
MVQHRPVEAAPSAGRTTRSSQAAVNVIGHGIDLAAAAERSDLLLARCLVQAELDELAIQFDRVERLAGLLPAKGGVLRALATGFDPRVDLSVRARVPQILSQLMATVGAVIRLRKNDTKADA